MGYALQQNQTAQPVLFFLASSSDHITGLTGKAGTVVVTISKNGGAFGSPAGAVSEIANGWYQVAGNATDANTLGPLVLHAKDAASDPFDDLFPVVAYNSQAAANLGLTDIDATISSRMATFTLPTNFSLLSVDTLGRVKALDSNGNPFTFSSAAVTVISPVLPGGNLDLTAGADYFASDGSFSTISWTNTTWGTIGIVSVLFQIQITNDPQSTVLFSKAAVLSNGNTTVTVNLAAADTAPGNPSGLVPSTYAIRLWATLTSGHVDPILKATLTLRGG